MARKTDRNFLVDFATLDIEYLPQKGPEVSDDIQMVYIMGDVSGAAVAVTSFTPGWDEPDPIRIEYGIQRFTGLVAGERTRMEVLAPAGGGGIWINSVSSPTSGVVDTNIFTIAALTGLATTVNPTAANSSAFGAGAAAGVIVEYGTSLVVAPATAMRIDIGEGANGRPEGLTGDGLTPIYIGPGRVFVVQMFSVAVSEFLGCTWREIA